jgi:hypothetical protein
MYEVGTLKLTWISPEDYSILESKMFAKKDLSKALEEAKSKNKWMIFELIKTQNDEYTWKLLPYGESERFVRIMKFKDSPLYTLSIIAGIGAVGFLIWKAYGK